MKGLFWQYLENMQYPECLLYKKVKAVHGVQISVWYKIVPRIE